MLQQPEQGRSLIGQVEVIDSLASEPSQEDIRDFIEYQAVTVISLGVEKKVNKASVKAAHRLGVVEMKKTPGRVKYLERESSS